MGITLSNCLTQIKISLLIVIEVIKQFLHRWHSSSLELVLSKSLKSALWGSSFFITYSDRKYCLPICFYLFMSVYFFSHICFHFVLKTFTDNVSFITRICHALSALHCFILDQNVLCFIQSFSSNSKSTSRLFGFLEFSRFPAHMKVIQNMSTKTTFLEFYSCSCELHIFSFLFFLACIKLVTL